MFTINYVKWKGYLVRMMWQILSKAASNIFRTLAFGKGAGKIYFFLSVISETLYDAMMPFI
jgi:hypothetical protein